MNLEPSRSTCFFTKQITLNNEVRFKDHIDSCQACKRKILSLLQNEEILKSHFSSYRASKDIQEQLLEELEPINSKLYPSFITRSFLGTKDFGNSLLLNSLIFVKNLFSIKSLTWIASSILFYLVAVSIINA